MSGTENKFAITHWPHPPSKQSDGHDLKSSPVLLENLKKYISSQTPFICKKSKVDGVVLLHSFQPHSPHYQWEFLNADGSTAEMCGNAARCVALYAFKNKLAPADHSFLSLAGRIQAFVKEEHQVSVSMTEPKDWYQQKALTLSSGLQNISFVNTGVPHAVKLIEQKFKENDLFLEEARTRLKIAAAEIRNHKDFQPHGANATFYFPISQTKIQAISFERGVEDFTKACGTGAVAAAYTHCRNNSHQQKRKQMTVTMPGGKLLVDFSSDKPLLSGSVKEFGELIV